MLVSRHVIIELSSIYADLGTMKGWKYYISYCIFLLFEVVFVYFIFPETSGRSLEELAFRTSSQICSVTWKTLTWSLVFEGNVQELQKQRVEQEIKEDPTVVTPGSKSVDKEDAYHLENIQSADK